MKEPLAEGMVFFGPGSCPKCYTNLLVADAEITLMELNSEGIPISEETVNRINAYCPKCKHKQLMFRWKGSYIPYDYFVHMQLLIEHNKEIEERRSAMNSKRNDDGFGEENPLAK